MAMSVRYTNFGGELVAEDRGGVSSFYVPDNLGSTVALKNTAGTTTDSFTYWPYGEIRTRTGSTATPFTFVGNLGYYQVSTSRYYVRARDLRADQARWQTVDPLWPDEMAYGYASLSPIIFSDSSGMQDSGKGEVFPNFGRGIPGFPNTGNYCGMNTSCTTSPPVDCIDKACQKHDACLQTKSWIGGVTCHCALFADALGCYGGGCRSLSCIASADLIIGFFGPVCLALAPSLPTPSPKPGNRFHWPVPKPKYPWPPGYWQSQGLKSGL